MMPLTIPRGLTIVVGALLPIATPLNAQNAPASTVVAFVDVNVIPMDRERVLGRQTVIVRNGRIASIEPSARARIPSGALRVDGRGKYLMPGLAEMHAHIPGPQAPEQVVRDIFTLYIANGITTIRGMLGAPNQLTLRAKTASGEMLSGPNRSGSRRSMLTRGSASGRSATAPPTSRGARRTRPSCGLSRA